MSVAKDKVFPFPVMTSGKTQNLLFYSALGVWACRAVMYIMRPEPSTDGPWHMSSIFSYMIGKGDYSLFGFEHSGKMFSTNLVDFIFSLWFRMTGLNTWGFITIGLLAVLLTLFVWNSLIRESAGSQAWPMTLVIIYAMSPYVYMFRPECFAILLGSVIILCLKRMRSEELKWPIAVSLTVISGLIHPLGGIFCGLVIGYALMEGRYAWTTYLKVAGWSLLLTFTLTGGHFLQFIQELKNRPADQESHFAGLHIDLLGKYALLGSPVLFLLLPLQFIRTGVYGRLFISACLLLLLLGGRSYYYPLLHLVALAVQVFGMQGGKPLFSGFHGAFANVIRIGLAYSLFAFLIFPLALSFMNHQSNQQWKRILTSIDREEKSWEKSPGMRYYVPPVFTMEVCDNINARSLYTFMYKDFGVQDARSRIFYIYQKSQRNWVKKNFNSPGTSWEMVNLEKPQLGPMRISSFYRMKPVYDDSIGLWRMRAVPDTLPHQASD